MSQTSVYDAHGMSDLIRTFAWVTREHSAALRNLASMITKYYVSYVKIVNGEVVSISPENAHTPSVENMLYRLHVQPYTQDPAGKIGRIAEDFRINLQELRDIRAGVVEVIRVLDGNTYSLGCVGLCLQPFVDVGVEVIKLLRGKNVTSNKAIEKHIDAIKNFRKKLLEIQWDKLPKAEPPTITETEADLSRTYLKDSIWVYYIKRFSTDFERSTAVFYLAVREIDNAFREYEEMVGKCKEKSGFMKQPPSDLTQSTLQAMDKFLPLLFGLATPCNLSEKYVKQYVFKQEALKAVDKALEKASKQGYINGKDARRLVSYYLGFEVPHSITRWMNR